MNAPDRTSSRIHQAILGAMLVLLMGLGAWLEPAFVTPRAQLELASHAFELGLLAIVMTLIIISGGIDLSVGSMMALSAVVLGLLFERGVPIWLACVAALIAGAAAGALNGFFVARLRVHPLIVTLATLALYRGLAEGISLGRPISGFPPGFLGLGNGTVLGMSGDWACPNPVLILALAAIVVGVIVARTVAGTWIYAIGGSETAARHCGISVNKTHLLLFTLSGLAAAVCGVVFAARRNTAKADVGAGIELEAITAVVLGGTSIFGGRGTILGTVLGVLLIHELRELVSWHWQHDELVMIVVGVILIGSVLLNNLALKKE